jgi:uncharacterized membrane protein
MPAKKARETENEGMRSALKWLYVGGAIAAGLAAGFGFSHAILAWVLLLIGLLAGFFYHDSADVMNFGLRYLIIWALTTAAPTFIAWVPYVGQFVANFLQGFFNFLGPVVLAMAIMHFGKKYFANE